MAKQRSADRGDEKAPSAEAEAFRAAVRDVKPLAQTAPADGLATSKPRVRRRDSPASVEQNLDEAMPLHSQATVSGGEPLLFQRAGVRLQVMRRLRRGLYPIDDELDLHGLSQTQARDRLADFLARSRDAGCL